jgi:tRNA-binding protein
MGIIARALKPVSLGSDGFRAHRGCRSASPPECVFSFRNPSAEQAYEPEPTLCQTSQMPPVPVKPLIERELLERLDVRVGSIEAVLDVDGSDKLVQLRVQFGDHTRTVVAGLKLERANPREIEGRQALFVVNLPPRKIRGVLSEGMLFDIGYADGITPVLAIPESPVPDGTRAG